ncbi:MAG: hypothetical protein ACR2P3_14680 [Geminicoccaceae bacterium]
MSDPEKLDCWSFGTWETVLHKDGLVEGRAIFDGARTFVRIDADPTRLLIDYHLGADRDRLSPRISVRVVPGVRLDLGADQAVLTFTAWRPATMDDARWRRLTASHEFEVVLLKSLIAADGPNAD